jgi:hypothetical protein
MGYAPPTGGAQTKVMVFGLGLCLTVLILIIALMTQAAKTAQLQPITHIALVMEENHNINQVTPGSMPYLTSLGTSYAKATHLSAITHPSLPNYFAVTSGSTQGKTNDCGSSTAGCTTKADNIYHQTNTDWAQWSESMPTPCDHQNAGAYVVHHAIPPFYTDLNSTCVANDRPFAKTSVPTVSAKFTFITPNNLDNATRQASAKPTSGSESSSPNSSTRPRTRTGRHSSKSASTKDRTGRTPSTPRSSTHASTTSS